MKKIVSMLLAIMMIIGMLPMGILSASAAEVSETVAVIANTGALSSDSLSISWTSGNITFTSNKSESSTAIRTSDSNHYRMYAGSSATITCAAGNITKIVVTATSDSYATVLATSAGAEATASGSTVTIVPTASAATYTIAKMTAQSRINSVEVTYSDVDASACAHTNTEAIEAVAATCTTPGNTEGVKCSDCGTTISGNETIAATGHTETSEVTAATCTEDGYTTYTCSVCGNTRKTDWVDAAGHIYVDGVCTCGAATPTDLAGKYYIAAIRSSGNYFYLTNEVNDSSRYVAVDSGLTELPESIETIVDAQVFELIYDATTYTYKIKTGDQYLGWTSGNTGALVDEATAITATIDSAENGAYNIRFSATDKVRYLAMNGNSGNDYFVWYGQGQAEDLYLIPVSATATTCEHTNTTVEGAVAATCTTAGSTGTTVCSDCGATTVEATEIAALGHTYAEGVCSVCGEAEVTQPAASSATITFDDITKQTSFSTTSKVWQENGIIVTNNKGSSTSDCASNSDPVRFYKNSQVIIAYTGMTKIEVACNTAAYATVLADSISDTTVSVSVNDKVVTIVPSAAIDSYTVTLSGGQVRVDSITVTASTCEHVWGEMVQTTAPTCTETGVNTSTCSLCGETKTETVAATGHTYTYVDGTMTCTCGDSKTISTIAEAKAYTSTSQVYYIKGIVTYASGKNVYIEDATGGICVYFAAAPSDIALGDEIVVWDTMTTYKGLIETTNTTELEYLKVSTGNTLPSQTVSIADLNADTTNEYLGERVVIENVTIGTINSSGNTALTDADGNTINLYKVSGLNEAINVNDVVTVTVIVSTYNAYQLLVNPGTAAADVVEIEHHDEVVIETVDIATAKAGTAGEYYQVEGVVTFIDGRNVYIQDATGGIVVYLTATNSTAAIGDKIKAYGQLKLYNGLIELDGIDQTNTEQFEVLSNGNTVDAQAVTVADVANDTTNEYLAEKITLNNVYVSYSYGYSSSYGNVNYILKDGDSTVVLYRVPAASEDAVMAGGTIINVEAIVSSYNGYQLRVVSIDSITVVGACAHETTELVNVAAATCTEAGYTGDTECVACGNYVTRGEEIAATGHSYNEIGVCANNCGIVNVAVIDGTFYTTFADAYAALTSGQYIKLLTALEVSDLTLNKDLWIDLNGYEASIAVTTVENGAVIYGMDCSTDSYAPEEWGVLTVTGAAVAPVAAGLTENSYLAVAEEDTWSFHAYKVKLTYVTLDPTNDALGYKAQIFGDEVVLGKVTGFGFHMGVEGGQQKTYSKPGAPTGGVFTLRLKNIMAGNGGEMSIIADAFVTFGSVEDAAVSNEYSTTMKATILKVNELWANYSDAQKTAAKALYTQYSTVMDAWFEAEGVTNNIAAWTPSETTV